MEEVVEVVIVGDIVAGVVSLDVLDQGLEVKVGKLVHDWEFDVLKELVVKLGGSG